MAERIRIAQFDLENLDELVRNTAEIKDNIDQLREANKRLKAEGKGASEQFVKNEADIKSLNKAYRDNIKFLAEANQQTADLAAREKLLEAALSAEAKTIEDLRAQNRILNKLRNTANLTTEEGRKEVERLNEALNRNNALIKESVDDYTQQKIGIGGYKDAIKEAFDELNPFNTEVIRGEGALKRFGAGVKGAAKELIAFVSTPVGALITALAGIGLIAREVFQYNNAVRESAVLTEALTNETGELADTIRLRAGVISEVFGNDFKENIESARALVNNFGVTYGEAFDIIEDGLLRGGSANTEFLDSIREYPVFFAQAGFSAEDFINILNTGADLSIYTDKLPDAIKEFTLSVTEQGQAQRDALENAFGQEFTDNLFKNIENGSITTRDALRLVSSEAQTASINAQQQAQLTADLFRGAGEDAGGALVIFEAVNHALSEESDILTDLEQQIARQLDLQNELAIAKDDALKSDSIIALSQEFQNFGTWIETQFYRIIGGIGDAFNAVGDRAVAIFTTIPTVARSAAIIAKDAINSIFTGEDLKAIAERSIGALTEVAETTYQSTLDTLQQNRDAVVEIERQTTERLVAEEERRLQAQFDRRASADIREAERKAAARQRELEREEAEQQKLSELVRKELTRREEEELQKTRDFEDRKRELQNEIELAKTASDEEKSLLQAEQRFEKESLELENLQLSEERKTELLTLLEENRGLALQEIKDKFSAQALEKQKAVDKAEVDAKTKNAAAVANVQRQLVGTLSGLLGDSLGAKLAEIALDAAIKANQVGIATETGAASNRSLALAAGFPANVPLLAAATAQNAAQRAQSATSISKILSNAAIRGLGATIRSFESGGLQSIGGHRHYAGGTKFVGEDGTAFEAEKGELIGVMNRNAAKHFLAFNDMFSGRGLSAPKSYLQDGGTVARSISRGSGASISEVMELIQTSQQSLRVINVADDTLDVINKNAIIVENASI